jgi:hypothetical protein
MFKPSFNGIEVRLDPEFKKKFTHLEQTFQKLLKSDSIVRQFEDLLALESETLMHLDEKGFLHWILQKKDEILYRDLQKYYLSLGSNEF